MRVYASEPPWDDRYSSFGWWKRGEELWDGSGFVWTLQSPLSPMEKILHSLQSYRPSKVSWLEDQLFPRLSSLGH